MAQRPLAVSQADHAIDRPSGEIAIGCGSRSNAVPGAVTSSSRATGGASGAGVRVPYHTAAMASPAQSSAMLQGISVQSVVRPASRLVSPATRVAGTETAVAVAAEVEKRWSDPSLTPV